MRSTQVKVLIVDAECVVAEMLSMALQFEGALAMTAYDACGALSAARSFRPDLVILDPRLPDMDGMLLLERLLTCQPGLLTIVLRNERVSMGLHWTAAAGDDWLAKPFSIEDALSRVRRVLRNNGINQAWVRSTVAVGDLSVDEANRSVSRGGEDIVLTPTEFQLLHFFVRNACRAVTPGEILGRVWKYDSCGQLAQVRLYVMYLRRRIDDGRDPMIHTVPRTGYVIRPPHPQRATDVRS
jgi:two-component system OmpR family response regulator